MSRKAESEFCLPTSIGFSIPVQIPDTESCGQCDRRQHLLALVYQEDPSIPAITVIMTYFGQLKPNWVISVCVSGDITVLRLVANGLGTFHYWYSSYYQSITTLIETYGTNPFQACVRVFHRLRNLRDVYMDRIFSPGCLLCLHVMPSASNQEREIQASRKAEVCWAATSVFNQWFVWNACLFYFCSFSFRFDNAYKQIINLYFLVAFLSCHDFF